MFKQMLELIFGISHLPLSFSSFTRTYDAYSTFYLNSSGLIYRHRLDKVSPRGDGEVGGGGGGRAPC